MRHIISTVCCLERATGMYPYFPAEYLTSTDYVPNTGPDWHPWQHVYAMTKVGAGSQHTPKFNPYGMYFVRLFFMVIIIHSCIFSILLFFFSDLFCPCSCDMSITIAGIS